MYCPDCGNELDGNGVCSVCGRRFDAKGDPAENKNDADKSGSATGAQQTQNAQQTQGAQNAQQAQNAQNTQQAQNAQNAQQQYSQNGGYGGYGYGYTNGYYGAPGGNYGYGYGYMQPQSDTANSYAIAGFVLSFIVPLVGLIISVLGYRKAKEMNGCGKGFAVAGIVISAVSLGSVLLIVVPVIIIYAVMIGVGTSGYYAFALPALMAALAL